MGHHQSHLNVAAVAVLKEIPMIIIASGREPAADLMARCETGNYADDHVAGINFGTCRHRDGNRWIIHPTFGFESFTCTNAHLHAEETNQNLELMRLPL